MNKKLDLESEVGDRYGRLVVTGYERRPFTYPSGKKEMKPFMHVRCDCGSERCVNRSSLKLGDSLSCGCLQRQLIVKRMSTHGDAGRGKRAPELGIWMSMKNRCESPLVNNYARYGGRGITVCDRWKYSYQNFLSDMGRKPTPGHSIDRIDNEKGYSPENCQWATTKEQQNNRRDNRKITFDGETKTLAQWAEYTKIGAHTISERLRIGWDVRRALTSDPSIYKNRKRFNSEEKQARRLERAR